MNRIQQGRGQRRNGWLALCGICLMLLPLGCKQRVDRDGLLGDIETMEQGLDYSEVSPEAVDSVQNAMVGLYRKFYTSFPNDSLAPVYMQRAADMLISLERTDEAVAVLDSIIAIYPDGEDIGGCWFLKGYAYEMAENYDSARVAYTYFVENYPDHYLAADTRMAIQYLGMSAEEMFEAIINAASDQGLSSL